MNRLTKSIPAALAFMFLISCDTFHINQSSIQKVLSSSKNSLTITAMTMISWIKMEMGMKTLISISILTRTRRMRTP